jgi:hypothetical protein
MKVDMRIVRKIKPDERIAIISFCRVRVRKSFDKKPPPMNRARSERLLLAVAFGGNDQTRGPA